jgi:acetyltransferase-like isoleucine patch superfamily enzyme
MISRIFSDVGRRIYVSYGTLFSKPTAYIGNDVYIGAYCVLGDVRVGDNTLIADHVSIPSGAEQHGIAMLDIPIMNQPGELRTIHIGADCWIGSNAVILADIGNHCVVGAGSVVTKPVPEYGIVAGNPARTIGDRRNLSPK